ncbi:glycosyltransferase family 4 protein [Rhizobium sp. CG5]|uniref:glycosyltransferase family 4 protein n=1 Tax=Rhizobium sp. CG5 TaxID=2726076 RepID=UPI00203325DA|nr:glycosyltransferase family 4 protein [Rhizobium sp. CG5]MCM2476087.1 glycosyltransferase family 4 protein [Rhizobium sp. CG5]
MKILVSAYACESGRGGEGEIGWRLVHHIAEHHEVWVITRANLRAAHEALFRNEAKPLRLHFVYFDLPWIFRFYKRGKRFFLVYYYLWQIGAGLLARRLRTTERFDLSHHLTGGMDWMPAGVALCGGPLLWGPVGSEDTHPVILGKLGLASRAKDRLRTFVRSAMRHVDPLVRLSGRRACTVLSHTPETMPRRLASKLQPFTQTGIENVPALARPKTDIARHGPLRILFAGELKDWKGALLALQATLNYFERGDLSAVMRIVGDGPLRLEMQAIIAAHPQGHRVVMMGRVPMESLVDLMRESDVFLYPSFHHGLATVVLQAMLTGLPVVCLEGDATGRTVGQEAGITVSLRRERDPVADLADALETLAGDESLRQTLAREGQRMAREQYTYAALAGAIEQAYQTIRSDPR